MHQQHTDGEAPSSLFPCSITAMGPSVRFLTITFKPCKQGFTSCSPMLSRVCSAVTTRAHSPRTCPAGAVMPLWRRINRWVAYISAKEKARAKVVRVVPKDGGDPFVGLQLPEEEAASFVDRMKAGAAAEAAAAQQAGGVPRV
jgi:hypothetical protein